MCGGFPNGTTSGKPSRHTFWQALVELLRGGRWYDAHTR